MDFSLTHVRGPFGDECSIYDVNFQHGATVSDLISFALSNTREWGYISVHRKRGHFPYRHMFEYKYGQVVYDVIPNEIKEKVIKKASAYGGWSKMDYDIEI